MCENCSNPLPPKAPNSGGAPRRFCSQKCARKVRGQRYYAKNRDRVLAAQRERAKDPQVKAAAEERRNRWRDENRDRVREQDRVRYQEDPARAIARTLRWRAANPRDAWSSRLKSKYGITADDYDALLASQGGACALCKRTAEEAQQRRLHVDHDHACCPAKTSCGRCVRGLLCGACNSRLGWLENRREDIESYIARKVTS